MKVVIDKVPLNRRPHQVKCFVHVYLTVIQHVGVCARSQCAANSLHDPHGHTDMQSDPPLCFYVVVSSHRTSVLLQPLLFLTKSSLQIRIPRNDQRVGFDVQRITATGVVRASDQADTRILFLRKRHPDTLSVVCPAAWLIDSAFAPFLDCDLIRAAFARHGFEESAGQVCVCWRKHATDALAAVEAVGPW